MKKIFTLLLAAAGAANVVAASDDNIIRYDFENYKLDGKYYTWFEKNDDDSENQIWGTGNAGYAVLHSKDLADTYPTAIWSDGRTGHAVKLETKDTYSLPSSNAPIAAGNIFLGKFDFNISLISQPVKMTKFGISYTKKPLSFSFYYKYAAGAKVQDIDRKEITNKVDKGNAYAVLYDNKGGDFQADGSNVLTNENIVAIANAGELGNATEWTYKNVSFEYSGGVDNEKLAAGGYNLALVFTSSINGASFEGAIGSVMYVDDVEIVCEGSDTNSDTKTYVDNLVVTLSSTGSDPIVTTEENAQVFVTKQTDGKYTFTLKNFVLDMQQGTETVMPVGTINIKDLEGTEIDGAINLNSENALAEIVDGDDESTSWMAEPLMQMFKDKGGVPVKIDARMTADKLYARLSIPLGFMDVDVEFGSITDGVNKIASEKLSDIKAIYTIDGKQVNDMQPGQVYILRKADGTSVKVIKK